MTSWFKSLFKSNEYSNLHTIVANSETINAELDKLSQNYPNESSKIRNLYQQLNAELTNIFDVIKQKPNEEKEQSQSPTNQTGGRRTKKSKKHHKQTKKSQKTKKTRK
jgi:hypothetical protein